MGKIPLWRRHANRWKSQDSGGLEILEKMVWGDLWLIDPSSLQEIHLTDNDSWSEIIFIGLFHSSQPESSTIYEICTCKKINNNSFHLLNNYTLIYVLSPLHVLSHLILKTKFWENCHPHFIDGKLASQRLSSLSKVIGLVSITETGF